MADPYGRLDVALVPSLPEQEAEAESNVTAANAASTVERQQSTPYAIPIDTTTTDEVDVQGGDSDQVPWHPPSREGAAGENHLHYWVHTVTETIDRGFYGFESQSWPLTPGVPVQLVGLDDLRPKTNLICLALTNASMETAIVYIGTRDMINSDFPERTGVWFQEKGDTWDYHARKELWAVVIGGTATIGVTVYKSEPTSDQLATQSKSSRGVRG